MHENQGSLMQKLQTKNSIMWKSCIKQEILDSRGVSISDLEGFGIGGFSGLVIWENFL